MIQRLIVFKCIKRYLDIILMGSKVVLKEARTVAVIVVDFHGDITDIGEKTILLDDISIHITR